MSTAACRSSSTDAPEAAQDPVVPEAPEEASPPPQDVVRIYGADGRLLASDDFIAGVRLPRGLELVREYLGTHTYRIHAPIQKVLSYFGPMLVTGKVDRQGRGAIYRNASVRGAEISPTKVDVSILETGDGFTRIAITERPPPPEYAPPLEQTLKRAKRDFKMLD